MIKGLKGFTKRHKVALIGLILGVITILIAQTISGSGDYSFEQSASSLIREQSTSIELKDSRGSQLVIPKGVSEDQALPLLINLHGYTGTGASQSLYTFLEQAAIEAGMAYIAPTGIKDNSGSTFWNADSACCNFNRKDVDDVSFIDSLIAKSLKAANIDAKRVYLFGHSNGAFMGYAYLCSGKTNVAAVAGIAGAMNLDPKLCKSSPSNILHIHGEKDATILYQGGSLFGTQYTSVEATLDQWSAINQCRQGKDSDMDILDSIEGVDTVKVSFRCQRGGLELWRLPQGEHSPVLDLDFARNVIVWLTSFEIAQS
jgi:polyhydroxybutyrate depolymerase